MTGAEAKTAAREAALARRSAAHAAGGDARARRHLADWLAPYRGRALAGYMPIRTEIDPRPVMAVMAAHGPVCLPVIEGPGHALRFRAWKPGVEMVEGPFGVPVPAVGDWLIPEVLIVPLVAFDHRGGRLGYGGGYYDRTLADLRAKGPTRAVGFAYAAQRSPEPLPLEPTDQPLDAIVTEEGVILP